jgi:hypothetical protein
MVETYEAIGEFVHQFSQLEFTIRVILGDALKIDEERLSILTASYDFATLCRVTHVYLRTSPASTPELETFLKKIFDRCLRLNQERVVIERAKLV